MFVKSGWESYAIAYYWIDKIRDLGFSSLWVDFFLCYHCIHDKFVRICYSVLSAVGMACREPALSVFV
jgi:hypothetical protein